MGGHLSFPDGHLLQCQLGEAAGRAGTEALERSRGSGLRRLHRAGGSDQEFVGRPRLRDDDPGADASGHRAEGRLAGEPRGRMAERSQPPATPRRERPLFHRLREQGASRCRPRQRRYRAGFEEDCSSGGEHHSAALRPVEPEPHSRFHRPPCIDEARGSPPRSGSARRWCPPIRPDPRRQGHRRG